jgi:cytidylate kinase
MAVITISREYGSRGDEIARRVCDLLHYSYFDKTLMDQVAREQGVSEAEAVDFSEDSYRLRGFVDALLGRSAPVATTSVWTSTTHGEEAKVTTTLDQETAARFVAATVRSLRQRGNVVVVGRGGQAILRGEPGVLHVRIVAGREDRIPRIMETEGLHRLPATDRMNERDRATAEYVRRFHGIDWADPLQYHLTINGSLMDVETAARLIVSAVRLLEASPAAQPASVAASTA